MSGMNEHKSCNYCACVEFMFHICLCHYWPLPRLTWVHTGASLSGICGGQNGTGMCFYFCECFGFSLSVSVYLITSCTFVV
jgi:hypothetical protein